MFQLIISVIVGIVGLFYLWFKISYGYFKRRGIAGPAPTFPYGNTPNLLFFRKNVVHDWDDMYQKHKGKETMIGMFEMKSPKFLLLDPELIKCVLIKNFKKFHDNEFSRFSDKDNEPILSRNPFMLRGEEWKEKRAEITPAFTPNRMKAIFPVIDGIVQTFKKYIENNNSTPLEAREICAKYTTDVVSSCIFNADAQSFTKENPEIREMGKKLFNFPVSAIIWFTLYTFLPFLTKVHKVKFISKEVEDFFTSLMEQAVEQRNKDKIDRDDYLAHLINLRNKKEMTEIDMAAHGVSFFLDGFETSSLTIAHVLYEIANNAEVQKKLRAEIDKVYDSNGKMNYEKLIENEYIDQVFHETLRMHPQATMINRECTEPASLTDSNGRTFNIKLEDSFYVPAYSLHRDSQYFPEPDKFNPERFNSENGGVKAFRDRGVFFPFGDGPRICIGMRFAMMQSKAAIAEIVKTYELSVNEKTQLPLTMEETNFLNVKKGGLWLNFKTIV